MIPKNIRQEHILKSIEFADAKGIPSERHSTKWSLEFNSKLYPPKFIISIANRYANDEEWEPSRFSGGEETNKYLEALGFEIIRIGSKPIEYPVESHSWTAVSDNVAIKVLDKSAFLHNGTGIPYNLIQFFDLVNFSTGDRKQVGLIYKNSHFRAHFAMDKPLKRMRLFWRSDFAEELKKALPNWYDAFANDKPLESERPVMRFNRVDSDGQTYMVELICPNEIRLDVEAEVEEEQDLKTEGVIKYTYSKRYERDPVNRRRAIETHGFMCVICGFNFESQYGDRGRGFIEIHHVKPLGSMDEEQIIDPKKDLMPVCANCHRMIHRRKDNILSIEEMKNIIASLKHEQKPREESNDSAGKISGRNS